MKYLLIALSGLLLVGCGTVQTIETPSQLTADISGGVAIGLDVYPAARPEITIAREVICAEVGKTNVNPVTIVADLGQAGITNSNSKLIVDGVIFAYNKVFNLLGDVSTNMPLAQSYLDATCKGLTDGLGGTAPMAKRAALAPHLR